MTSFEQTNPSGLDVRLPLKAGREDVALRVMEKRKKVPIRVHVSEFGNNTSFHGIRYVTESSFNFFRRVTWLLLVLTCLGVLIYQIVDRVTYYYKWPVTVNVKVNYNNTLKFPAVTICNQNAFKATLSASLNRYRLIEEMFSESDVFDQSKLETYSAGNISLLDLYIQSSHKQNDFIFRQVWKGSALPDEDIEQTITDHGVCYTFRNTKTDGYISTPGVENGLRLTLNIEQYEYMPGPHDAAGIKILIHDPKELPRVHALGQAVSPGSHVFVGIKIVEVTNLDDPHGTCMDKELEFVDFYTTEACQLDCLTGRAYAMCGCRSTYMPQRNGRPPICNLDQYYRCLKDVIDTFPSISDAICACPVPCHFRLYETDISYASTSDYSLSKFLSDNDMNKLSKSLLNATEVTSRYENSEFSKVKTLYKELKDKISMVNTTVVCKLATTLDSLIEYANKEFITMQTHYQWKEYLYRYQIYIMKKNFMRPRDAFEERTFHIIALAYAEFILSIENRIRMLTESNFSDNSTRYMLYQATKEMLDNRKEIIHRALHNFSTLINAYDTGMQIFNYKFFKTPRSHNIPAAPKPLIRQSRIHNNYARKYGRLFGQYLNRTLDVLDMCSQLVNISYLNSTLDEDEMTLCREDFRYLMRNWVFARSVFYFETVDWPVGILEKRHEKFEEKWNAFKTVFENMNQSLISLKSQTVVFSTATMKQLLNLKNSVKHYLNDSASKNIVSQIFTSDDTQLLLTNFELYFQEIRSREITINDWLKRMKKESYDIWNTILDDEDSWEYYKFVNKTDYLRNSSRFATELNETYSYLETSVNFSEFIDGQDSALLTVFHNFIEHMKEFQNRLKLDSSFIKDNFLQLDLFYRQMSYEEIHQQEAYDMFSLWCDIGGTMGLFMGASFLSIVEVVDFFFTQMGRTGLI